MRPLSHRRTGDQLHEKSRLHRPALDRTDPTLRPPTPARHAPSPAMGAASLSALLAPLLAALLVAGCSKDDGVAPSGAQPEPTTAASLAAPAVLPALVGGTVNDVDLFANPTSSLAEDAGIYQETPLDGWQNNAPSYPAKSAQLAAAARTSRRLAASAAPLAPGRKHCLEQLVRVEGGHGAGGDKAAGDTISVEYFDSPDSTGLNALLETETADIVRYVELRQYPAHLGAVVRRQAEAIIDTGGSLTDPGDDEYHSFSSEQEMFGGEITTCTLVPVSGSGPLLPGTRAVATCRVEDPRFHPLQAWTETEAVVDPGDLRLEGDESVYSLAGTVHWRNGAEQHAQAAAVAGGAIGPATEVEALGRFEAAPDDVWLETVADTLRVLLGDIDEEDDDLLLRASRGAIFDGTAADGGQPRSHIRYLPDEPVPPGEEPCGGQARQEIWYPAQWWLVHLLREAEVDCNGSGSLHALMEMRDGTSCERTITWDGTGSATLAETRPDGTAVSGSYDQATGAYSLVTNYPAGHDPLARDRHGTSLVGSLEAWEVVTWQDAHPDTAYFTATETADSHAVTGYRVDGQLREEFAVISESDLSLTGTWSRSDGASGQYTIERIEGGGTHVNFAAVDLGETGEPSLQGELWFAPDSSGYGTLTFTQYGVSVTYDITFGPDGSGAIEDGDGNLTPIG
jgi:hypothetical protein